MKAIHFICKQEGIGFHLLDLLGDGHYKSGCWDLTTADAEALVGGWVYLHPDGKGQPSQFGGIVDAFETCSPPERVIHKERYAFVLRAQTGGKGQKWRGASHGMAWTGGLVDAMLPHEIPSAAAQRGTS